MTVSERTAFAPTTAASVHRVNASDTPVAVRGRRTRSEVDVSFSRAEDTCRITSASTHPQDADANAITPKHQRHEYVANAPANRRAAIAPEPDTRQKTAKARTRRSS